MEKRYPHDKSVGTTLLTLINNNKNKLTVDNIFHTCIQYNYWWYDLNLNTKIIKF